MLICPSCKSNELKYSEIEIICNNCKNVFPVDSGIPCFSPGNMHNNDFFDAKIFSLFEKAANKHFWFHGRKSLIYSFIRKFLTENINILEIGSGVGDVAERLNKYGFVKTFVFETEFFAVCNNKLFFPGLIFLMCVPYMCYIYIGTDVIRIENRGESSCSASDF